MILPTLDHDDENMQYISYTLQNVKTVMCQSGNTLPTKFAERIQLLRNCSKEMTIQRLRWIVENSEPTIGGRQVVKKIVDI